MRYTRIFWKVRHPKHSVPMKHYRLIFTSDCTQDCVFCLAKDDPRVRLSFPEVVALLKQQRARGAELLSIDGGEPTNVPYFPSLITKCLALGFKKIAVKTNGYGFADKRFSREVLEGRQDVIKLYLSLHGHNKNLHDRLSRVKGSFAVAMRAIRNVVNLDASIVTNIVVCSENFRFLKQYIDVLVQARVSKTIFLFIVPEGNALRNSSLIPALPEVIPYVQDAVDYANIKGVYPALTFFPFCALDPYYISYAAEAYMPDRFKDPEAFSARRHRPPQCLRCACYRLCPGVWEAYYTLHSFCFKPFPVRRRSVGSRHK